MSTAAQRTAIKEFRAVVTGSTDAVATAALKKTSWNLERAIDAHFSSTGGSRPGSTPPPAKADGSKLTTLFNKYAGTTEKDKDVMYDEKLASFFTAIGVDPAGGATLGIAWKLKCKTIGEISRKEFTEGFTALGADTIEKITTLSRTIQTQLDSPKDFKEFYKWLFDFVKEEGERKTIDAQMAVEMWGLTFGKHFPLLPKWLEFVQAKATKTISKDIWLQLYEFSKEVKPDLSNFDPDAAWPGLIDEFVTHLKSPPGERKSAAKKAAAAASDD